MPHPLYEYPKTVPVSPIIPNVFTGPSAFAMFGGSGWGVYADVKHAFDSPGDDEVFYPDETPGDAAARNDQRNRGGELFPVGAQAGVFIALPR